MTEKKQDFWNTPLTRSLAKPGDVKLPEMLLGYFIGPFGALLSSGIFTSILQNYFTDVLKLNLTFLTTLQLVSTILMWRPPHRGPAHRAHPVPRRQGPPLGAALRPDHVGGVGAHVHRAL